MKTILLLVILNFGLHASEVIAPVWFGQEQFDDLVKNGAPRMNLKIEPWPTRKNYRKILKEYEDHRPVESVLLYLAYVDQDLRNEGYSNGIKDRDIQHTYRHVSLLNYRLEKLLALYSRNQKIALLKLAEAGMTNLHDIPSLEDYFPKVTFADQNNGGFDEEFFGIHFDGQYNTLAKNADVITALLRDIYVEELLKGEQQSQFKNIVIFPTERGSIITRSAQGVVKDSPANKLLGIGTSLAKDSEGNLYIGIPGEQEGLISWWSDYELLNLKKLKLDWDQLQLKFIDEIIEKFADGFKSQIQDNFGVDLDQVKSNIEGAREFLKNFGNGDLLKTLKDKFTSGEILKIIKDRSFAKDNEKLKFLAELTEKLQKRFGKNNISLEMLEKYLNQVLDGVNSDAVQQEFIQGYSDYRQIVRSVKIKQTNTMVAVATVKHVGTNVTGKRFGKYFTDKAKKSLELIGPTKSHDEIENSGWLVSIAVYDDIDVKVDAESMAHFMQVVLDEALTPLEKIIERVPTSK